MTENGFGYIVSGTEIQFPDDDNIYIVGEIFSNGRCKLYNSVDVSYKGVYNVKELKPYVR